MNTDAIQMLGSSLMMGLAASGLLLRARSNGSYCRYTKEGLLALSTYLMFQVLIRYLAVPFGLIDQTEARNINGLAAGLWFIQFLFIIRSQSVYWRVKNGRK